MRNPFARRKAPPSPYAGVGGLKEITRTKRSRLLGVIGGSLVVVGLLAAGGWYAWAIGPLDSGDSNHVRVTIATGTQPAAIGQELVKANLIRSTYAFQIYTRITGQEGKLQAGTYAFAPNQSLKYIVGHLVSGKTDEFSLTILPGQTLKDIRTMLMGHGYSANEIDAAMAAEYTNALVASRPSGASLEGFFYPDTYNVLSDESLSTIFERIFDHLAEAMKSNAVAAGFSANGLTFYQGLTLASIVQREVAGADEPKAASVFYNRLDAGIPLGSDVTYIYGASLLGVTPTPTLDSPYNTRIHPNLPPTPISNPGLSAIQAVSNPAKTDYRFFLSGDDGVTYFAHTDAEHEANIAQHCKIKCQ